LQIDDCRLQTVYPEICNLQFEGGEGMRLYVDLRSLQDPRYAFRGIGHVGSSVLRHVRRFLPEVGEIVGLLDEQLPELPESYLPLVDHTQFGFLPTGGRTRAALFYQPSPMTHDPAQPAILLRHPAILSCTVVYDFIPLEERRYLPTPAAQRQYLGALAWLESYQAFGCISASTARRLIDLLAPPGGRVANVGASLRAAFEHFDPLTAAHAARIRFAPGRYFVLVGGHDPRKNTEAAVRATARLAHRFPTLGLVVVGDYGPDYQTHLQQLYQTEAEPLSSSRRETSPESGLEFVRGISDEELAVLYHRAVATVCPSHREGFSLPVVEALACGGVVLASDIPAHRELIRQREALFCPHEVSELMHRMERILTDPSWRTHLQQVQSGVAERFTEERVAERFWGLVRGQCRLRLRLSPCHRSHGSHRGTKPRVAWLSPYPPDRSGVADYTACTVRALAEHAEVDIFTETVDGDAPRHDPWVRRFEPLSCAPWLSGEYDAVVAVIGNSHFHAGILDAHRRFGGPCLMHDNRLAEFYSWREGNAAYAQRASRSLRRPVSQAEAEMWIREPHRLPTLLFDDFVRRARPFLVHSRALRNRVEQQYGVQAQHLPFCCYRQFDEDEISEAGRREARRRLGIPEDRPLIVTLGILSMTKGLLECLWAVELLHAWGLPADFCFVGPAGGFAKMFQPLVEQLGLEEFVHFLPDWISESTYRDYIRAADLGVQLRAYGFGQISGALSDCISGGLPTVANEDLAASVDAPEYVLRVPDHLSPLLVAEQLLWAWEEGMHRHRRSPARTAYLAEHNFDHYARTLLRVLQVA
jgi:glycosyltransferase involved in cell wall biosynthesis